MEKAISIGRQGRCGAAMVLVPGAAALGRDEPRLQALARTFARAGFAVLVPELPEVRSLKLSRADAERVASALRHLGGAQRGVPLGVAAVSYAVAPAIIAVLARGPRTARRLRRRHRRLPRRRIRHPVRHHRHVSATRRQPRAPRRTQSAMPDGPSWWPMPAGSTARATPTCWRRSGGCASMIATPTSRARPPSWAPRGVPFWRSWKIATLTR